MVRFFKFIHQSSCKIIKKPKAVCLYLIKEPAFYGTTRLPQTRRPILQAVYLNWSTLWQILTKFWTQAM